MSCFTMSVRDSLQYLVRQNADPGLKQRGGKTEIPAHGGLDSYEGRRMTITYISASALIGLLVAATTSSANRGHAHRQA